MQENMLCGDRNVNVSRFIFKARSTTLDIKSQQKWKYYDMLCSGCNTSAEAGEDIFVYIINIAYKWFYSDLLVEQVSAGKLMLGKLKIRKSLREEIT